MYDKHKCALYRKTVVIINPLGDGQISDKMGHRKIMLIWLSYLSQLGTTSQIYNRIISFHCKIMPNCMITSYVSLQNHAQPYDRILCFIAKPFRVGTSSQMYDRIIIFSLQNHAYLSAPKKTNSWTNSNISETHCAPSLELFSCINSKLMNVGFAR